MKFISITIAFLSAAAMAQYSDVCEGTQSTPIAVAVQGSLYDAKCQNGTGFCADDGGYYICNDNKYTYGKCDCPNRYCQKKAMFIECERRFN